MEKGPEIRIVGGASAEKKERVAKETEEALFDHLRSLTPQEQEQLAKFEHPKSEKELALIDFANRETSQLMQEAGVTPYDIPAENYHIVSPELYKKICQSDSTATAFTQKQGIIFNTQHFHDNLLNFGATTIHESLHLKAHFSIEAQEEDGNVSKTPYREGVTVRASQYHGFNGKYHHHFMGLHEAIVAETEKRLLGKLLMHPVLKEEREWMASEEAQIIKKRLMDKKNVPEDDIIWVNKDDDNNYHRISYPRQREVLNYVCNEIQQQFPTEYQNADEVYKMFLNANFTGRLLPLARLVERIFGKGSFRLLGNMETDKQSGVLYLESLRKARIKQKKQVVN